MPAAKQPAHASAGSPYQVPPEPNRWPSIGLAVGMHALLLAFLWIGVSWQNNTPVAIEAEVWDVKVQTAAPPPPPPQEAEPEPQPEQPKPVEKAVEPPPVETPAPPKQPDIALEREQKRKEALKKRQEEERVERERELAEEKKAEALAEKKAQEQAKKDEDAKKAKELAKKQEAEKKKQAEKEKAEKEKADKLAKAKAEKLENEKLAKLHADQVKRMLAAAGSATSTGDAEKSTAPRSDKGYEAAIVAKVKGNTSYPGSLDEPGNPTVIFHVEQLPTGEIISVRKTKSSGVAAFDDAVEKGIHKSSPLPKKKDGTVARSLDIEFHMKDLQ